jgi:hypothetical protein
MVSATFYVMHLGVIKKVHELVLKIREVLHLQNAIVDEGVEAAVKAVNNHSSHLVNFS